MILYQMKGEEIEFLKHNMAKAISIHIMVKSQVLIFSLAKQEFLRKLASIFNQNDFARKKVYINNLFV